jgi:hypothetical protein
MRGASTLLPHVSEISFPIQKRVEFGRFGELELVDPAGALGVFIDEFGLAGQRFVYVKKSYLIFLPPGLCVPKTSSV